MIYRSNANLMNPYINEDWTPERPYSIYSHTSPKGKVYIGLTKHKNVAARWRSNGRGYRMHTVFSRAIKKYGWDNFEHKIVRTGLTLEEAQALERELIAFYKSLKMSYNMDEGGACTPEPAYGNKAATGMRRIHNEESGQEKNVLPEELDEYLSQGWKLGLSQSTKDNIGKSMKGLRTSEGRVLSDETKKKISATSKGRKLSAESRAKIGKASSKRIRINNGVENRAVHEEELEWFLSRGYKLGEDRSLPSPHGSLKRIWITNGVENKTIDKVRLWEYEERGWWRGKTKD